MFQAPGLWPRGHPLFKSVLMPYKTSEQRRRHQTAYYHRNREARIKCVQKRRHQLRELFFKMYGENCVICGYPSPDQLARRKARGWGRGLEVDHVLTNRNRESHERMIRRAIKEHRPDLFRPVCASCNRDLYFKEQRFLGIDGPKQERKQVEFPSLQ